MKNEQTADKRVWKIGAQPAVRTPWPVAALSRQQDVRDRAGAYIPAGNTFRAAGPYQFGVG